MGSLAKGNNDSYFGGLSVTFESMLLSECTCSSIVVRTVPLSAADDLLSNGKVVRAQFMGGHLGTKRSFVPTALTETKESVYCFV